MLVGASINMTLSSGQSWQGVVSGISGYRLCIGKINGAVLLSPWVVHADGFLCTRVRRAARLARKRKEESATHDKFVPD